jgi:hypothetical protein
MIVCGGFACGGDVDPVGTGSVALEWDVRPRGCVAAGVDTVSVQFNGPERVIESFPCTDGAGEVEGLKPGRYDVSIFGLDSQNRRTFWVEPTTANVRGDRTFDLTDLDLTARPAEVEVFWTFANGRVCGANDVDEIEVVVFDKLDYEVARETFACDEGVAPMTGFPAGTYVFEVTAEVADIEAWYGVESITVERGEDAQIDVALDRI